MYLTEIIVLVFLVCWLLYAIWNEWYQWNSGFCRKTGEPWKHFDNDSIGSSGYMNSQGDDIWVFFWDKVLDKRGE